MRLGIGWLPPVGLAALAASGLRVALDASSPGKPEGKPAQAAPARARPSPGAERGPAPTPLAPTTVESEAARLARRTCAALHDLPARRRAHCCGTPPRAPLAGACERALREAIERGAVRLDESAVERCERAARVASSGCDWVTPTLSLPPKACNELPRGLVGEGGECRSSLECRDPLHCRGVTPTASGRCAAPRRSGEPCGSTADPLSAYLLATDVEADGQCEGTCSLAEHRCVPGAVPDADGNERADDGNERADDGNERRPLGPAGSSCRSDLDCATGGCVGAPEARHCGMKCVGDASTADSRSVLSLPRRPPAAPARLTAPRSQRTRR